MGRALSSVTALLYIASCAHITCYFYHLQVLHFAILYFPWAAALFSVTALSWADWAAVMWLSAPVVLLDECLKVG